MSTMEALASNVPVIVPDTERFQELVPAMYRIPELDFTSASTFLPAAKKILSASQDERQLVEKFDFHKVMDVWFAQ